MTNNGNILSLNTDANNICNVKLPYESDGDNKSYIFKKIFITTPSLHRINNTVYDMEIFIVFTSKQKDGSVLKLVLCTLLSGTDAIPSTGDSKLLTYKLLNELFSGKNIVPEIHGTSSIKLIPNPIDISSFIPPVGDRSFYSYIHPKNLTKNIRVFKSTLLVSNNILSILKNKLTPGNKYENMKNIINTTINPASGLFLYYSEDFTNNYLSFSTNKGLKYKSNDNKDKKVETFDNDFISKKKTNTKKKTSIKKKETIKKINIISKKSNKKKKSKTKSKKEKFTNKTDDNNDDDNNDDDNNDDDNNDDDVENINDNNSNGDDCNDNDDTNDNADDDTNDDDNDDDDDDDDNDDDNDDDDDDNDDDDDDNDDDDYDDDDEKDDNKSKKIEKYASNSKNTDKFVDTDNKNIVSVIMNLGFILVSLLFLYIIICNLINSPTKNPIDKQYFMDMFNKSADFKYSTLSKISFIILYILCIFLGLIMLIYLLLFFYNPTKFLIKSSNALLISILIFIIIIFIFLVIYVYYRFKTNNNLNSSDYSACDKYTLKMFEWFSIKNIFDTIKGNDLTDNVHYGGNKNHLLPGTNLSLSKTSEINNSISSSVESMNPLFIIVFMLFIPFIFILSCYLIPNNNSIYSKYVQDFVTSGRATSVIYSIIYCFVFLFSFVFTGVYINQNYLNIQNSTMIIMTLFIITLIVLSSICVSKLVSFFKASFIFLLVFLSIFLLFLGYICYKKYFEVVVVVVNSNNGNNETNEMNEMNEISASSNESLSSRESLSSSNSIDNLKS
jgi:hypothetical protein